MSATLRRRLCKAAPASLLAGVIYIPLLLTAPGKVGADTKSYLYLDPGRMLGRAASMWDPNIGMGTHPSEHRLPLVLDVFIDRLWLRRWWPTDDTPS